MAVLYGLASGRGRMLFSCLVAIASRASNEMAKAVRDIGDFVVFRTDVKGSLSSYGDSPNMRSSASKRLWDNCSNQISCLVPKVAFVSLAVTDGQADLVGVAHATMAAS